MKWMAQPFRVAPVDIIQEPNGQVWVTTDEPKYWGNYFERVDWLHAKDYRATGGPFGHTSYGPRTRSGRASNGYAGRSSGDGQSSYGTRDNYFGIDTRLHELLEEYFGND